MRSRLLKLLCFALLLAPASFGRARTQGYCEQGGKTVVVSGLNGVPQVQGSYPSCNVRVFFSGLSGAVSISSISRTSNVVTVVLSGPITYLLPTAIVTIAGVGDTSFNGSFTVATVTSSSNTFTYAQTAANSTSSGGTAAFSPVLFQDNAGTPLGNPFSASNTGAWFFYADNSRYDVQLSGGGIPSPFTVGDINVTDPSAYFILSGNNTATGTNNLNGPTIFNAVATFNANAFFTTITSLSANPAASGFLRMATADVLCWRLFAGGADICLNKNSSDQLLFGANLFAYLNVSQTFTASQIFQAVVSFQASPSFAATPAFSVTSNQVIPNLNASLLLGANWGSPLAIGNVAPAAGSFTSVNANFFQTNSANPAASGILRCATADLCAVFRNNANSGDVGLGKNASDQPTFGGNILPTISGAVTPGHLATYLNSGQIQDGGSPGVAINQASITTLGGNNPLSANTPTTIMTKVVTMPASGGPWRAFVSTSVYMTTATSTIFNTDVNDGTNTFDTVQMGTGSNGTYGASGSSFSTGTYTNNAVITFTLTAECNTACTVNASPQMIGQNSWMNVVIMPSN